MTQRELQRIAERARAAELEILEGYERAAKRARKLLDEAEMAPHPYLARKGFPDMLAPCSPDGSTLYVTMYKAGKLCNLQRIAEDGTKRFLFGGDVIGAVHTIGDQGRAILCEGFATGVSVAAAIRASKMRAHCVVCFTAGNLVKVAKRYPGGAIIADNDSSGTGEKAAKKTGLRYWMAPDVDTDFNDFHKAKGLFAASMVVRGLALLK
jgi:putative DNA primase/helicase